MKNGCGRLSQNDVISVILSQKGKPLTGVIDSEGWRARAVLLRIVLCVEGNSTSESREPWLCGERDNALASKFKNGSDPGTQIPFRW